MNSAVSESRAARTGGSPCQIRPCSKALASHASPIPKPSSVLVSANQPLAKSLAHGTVLAAPARREADRGPPAGRQRQRPPLWASPRQPRAACPVRPRRRSASELSDSLLHPGREWLPECRVVNPGQRHRLIGEVDHRFPDAKCYLRSVCPIGGPARLTGAWRGFLLRFPGAVTMIIAWAALRAGADSRASPTSVAGSGNTMAPVPGSIAVPPPGDRPTAANPGAEPPVWRDDIRPGRARPSLHAPSWYASMPTWRRIA